MATHTLKNLEIDKKYERLAYGIRHNERSNFSAKINNSKISKQVIDAAHLKVFSRTLSKHFIVFLNYLKTQGSE